MFEVLVQLSFVFTLNYAPFIHGFCSHVSKIFLLIHFLQDHHRSGEKNKCGRFLTWIILVCNSILCIKAIINMVGGNSNKVTLEEKWYYHVECIAWTALFWYTPVTMFGSGGHSKCDIISKSWLDIKFEDSEKYYA